MFVEIMTRTHRRAEQNSCWFDALAVFDVMVVPPDVRASSVNTRLRRERLRLAVNVDTLQSG